MVGDLSLLVFLLDCVVDPVNLMAMMSAGLAADDVVPQHPIIHKHKFLT